MSKKRESAFGAFEGLFGEDSNMETSGRSAYTERMFEAQKGESRPVTDIPVEDLIEDPDNRKIYGNYKTDGLTESIEKNGFKGVIFAYPCKEVPGKYRIESGHRSLDAAKKAGKEKVPVLITDPPRNEVERRRRLVLANLHGRVFTPLMSAQQAEYLFRTYQMEQEKKKKDASLGLPETDDAEDMGDLNGLVAKDLEVSRPLVLKYRQLYSLQPCLKELSDRFSWSALAEAASLSEKKQGMLAGIIQKKAEADGDGSCTRPFIQGEIRKLRTLPDGAETVSEENKEKKEKRVDAIRYIRKTSEYLEKAFSADSFLKEKSVPEAREELEKMRDLIEKKLEEIGPAGKEGKTGKTE